LAANRRGIDKEFSQYELLNAPQIGLPRGLVEICRENLQNALR